MRARTLFRGLGFFLALTLATGGVVVLTSGARDSFHFLDGHAPFARGVFPIIEDGRRSKGFTDEYRMYCWQEDFESVVADADQELSRLGFKRERSGDAQDHRTWSRNDGTILYIAAMHCATRKDVFANRSATDDGWVTVISSNPVSDTWVTHVRYALEPNDY